jgi:hypothetical protein
MEKNECGLGMMLGSCDDDNEGTGVDDDIRELENLGV